MSCSSQSAANSTTTGESAILSESTQDIRQIAFEQLSSESKAKVKGTWRNAKLSTIILSERMGIIHDKSYIGKEVYLVDFPTKNMSVPNNMIYYVSKDTHKLIGAGYIE